mmetsp:Transcript_124325/g.175376  ORF Transcript_124325/g.175376 Transcript_124325/m.175376 type:complete len:129 (+) Transcript_124325:191-577(+)
MLIDDACVFFPFLTNPREVTPVLGAPLTAPSTPTAVDWYPTEVLFIAFRFSNEYLYLFRSVNVYDGFVGKKTNGRKNIFRFHHSRALSDLRPTLWFHRSFQELSQVKELGMITHLHMSTSIRCLLRIQ